MRIVVVSGHYPPNFVSGGSLVPQRLANALRQRGHEVFVYAGRLDEDRPVDGAFDDVEASGLPVRWLVTTPHDDWASDSNWRNPVAEDDFAAFLQRTEPDVVHLHDLQMLGGGMVRVAKQAGAQVVVTMHDFWWTCARLFLVDKALHPCSLVVDAGSCACSRNHGWLVRRNAALRQDLEHADLLLAVSASQARIVEANGLAVAPLEVDENGLPAEDLLQTAPKPRAVPPHGEDLRFLYAGGKHDLKGATLVLKAAHELRHIPGWQLDVYGVDEEHARNVGLAPERLPIRFLESFAPAERGEIFQRADVAVIPSIMLETYSILTREVLSRGMPVICSNSLGPEEVVTDGVNGLIFPVGDVALLAQTMGRCVADRDLVARLGSDGQADLGIRHLEEHAASLEARFDKLLAERPRTGLDVPRSSPSGRARTRPTTSVRRVVYMCGIEGAPLRYRARLSAEALALHDVATDVWHYRDPRLESLPADTDVLYVYRVPATFQVLHVIARAKERGIPVIFDVDDLIFDPDLADEIPALKILPPDEADGWLYGVRRYRTTMEACDGYVGSTPMLLRHAEAVTGLPTAQFDNGVGAILGSLSDRAMRRPRTDGPVRIGYLSGTITHDRDWFYVEPAIIEILDRHRHTELWLAGHLPDSPALEPYGDRIKRLPFTSWTKLPATLHDLDISLAPLEPNSRFNEAKSAIKWLEASLVGTPSVTSPTEPFRDAIDHGVSGYLAGSLDEWTESLDRLVVDERHRRLVGLAARREALLRWSPHRQAERFLAILDEARSWPELAAERPDNGWQPAIADEPFEPLVLEPYTASATVDLHKRVLNLAAQARWTAFRTQRAVERDGLAPTMAKAPRVAARSGRALTAKIRQEVATSRPRELVTYSRRMVDDRGVVETAQRAGSFARNRITTLPGVRHLLGAWRRLCRAFAKHGVKGTVDLAKPVVRHHVLHTWTRLRGVLQRLVRAFRP